MLRGSSLCTLLFLTGACDAITGVDSLTEVDCTGSCDASPAEAGVPEGSPRSDASSMAETSPMADASPIVDAVPTADTGPIADAGPPAPIAFHQATSTTLQQRSTSYSISFDAPIQAHDAIIVAMNFDNGATLTNVTDALGNIYTILLGPLVDNGTTHYVAIAENTLAGADTVTFTLNTPPTYFQGFIHEYAGLRQGAFDVGTGASGTSTGTDVMTSGPVVTHWGNELIFGFADSAGQASTGSGFQTRTSNNGNLTEDRIAATAGTYQTIASNSGAPEWTMVIATFRGN